MWVTVRTILENASSKVKVAYKECLIIELSAVSELLLFLWSENAVDLNLDHLFDVI